MKKGQTIATLGALGLATGFIWPVLSAGNKNLSGLLPGIAIDGMIIGGVILLIVGLILRKKEGGGD